MERTRSTAMKNEHDSAGTSRRARVDVAKPGTGTHPEGIQDADTEHTAILEAVNVVGGSRSGKGRDVNAGDLPGQEAERPSAGVRTTIVAMKPGNAGGAKGGRKADAWNERKRENKSEPPPVSETNKQGGEDLWQRHKAQRGVWSEGMLVALENRVKGKKWFSLIDKIYGERTLRLAWEQVLFNAGACGVDGMTVGRFNQDSPRRLLAVNEQLKAGNYQPEPVKRVWIPKPGSTQKRPLGIPTVKDRVVQTAARMVLEPIFESTFAEHSYGFRPGRGCHDALARVEVLLEARHLHIVDIDIKGYFDSIPQEKLLHRVGEQIADGRVMDLLRSFLKAGVMEEEGEVKETTEGTPQGGVISPLLANIYLNPLDWLMAEAGYEMVRYADDMVVLCRDGESARKALETVAGWMKENGLVLHPEKTRIVNMAPAKAHFDFLGYRFYRSSQGQINWHIRPKSRQKFKARVKPLTRRSCGKSLEELVSILNPILRGFYGYFKKASNWTLDEMDGWVRERLRGILRNRRKCSRGRPGWNDWKRYPNSYFHKLGLFCLEKAQVAEMTNLQTEAC